MFNNYGDLHNSILSYMYMQKNSKMAAWSYLYEFISPSHKVFGSNLHLIYFMENYLNLKDVILVIFITIIVPSQKKGGGVFAVL